MTNIYVGNCNFFELRYRPLHGFCPFRKQHSLMQFCISTARIMKRHFAYQTLGAVRLWIQSCAGKLGVELSRVTKRLSTLRIVAGQEVGTQRRSGHRLVRWNRHDLTLIGNARMLTSPGRRYLRASPHHSGESWHILAPSVNAGARKIRWICRPVARPCVAAYAG
jgi:hypothetical protein